MSIRRPVAYKESYAMHVNFSREATASQVATPLDYRTAKTRLARKAGTFKAWSTQSIKHLYLTPKRYAVIEHRSYGFIWVSNLPLLVPL